ncbi:cupin domain-containing protein [Hydrogenophaga sp. PAMC20947]|uniref:cupin domain-containing protein n=1 Tax=Hydrogenophaga sp. PAMC20947 TaxID=2565558 RepID=UPI00109DE4F6|nr:cupin domain-containing protein [Hydrogenophaga sp. PAMC20947]QCB48014.1 cupin domain-containing protein [Hydrogenophaga sp. PAMC20947]
MSKSGQTPVSVASAEVPVRRKPSLYPEPFASRMVGREKRVLGDLFGLSHFGVNLTHLAPGSVSSLRHAHTRQDEFIYVVEGHPNLHTNLGVTALMPGDCAGFKAGSDDAHCLHNPTSETVIYLEVGDRTPGDDAHYPDEDLQAVIIEGDWVFLHKDGTPYP